MFVLPLIQEKLRAITFLTTGSRARLSRTLFHLRYTCKFGVVTSWTMQNTCDVSMRTNYTTQLDLAIQKIRNLKGKWPRASYCTKGKWSEGTLMSTKSF